MRLGLPPALGDGRGPDLGAAVHEIGVTDSDDIVARRIGEEAERRSNARVDVEELVAPVPRVEPQAEIDDAAVTDGTEEPDDLRLKLMVGRELSEGGEAAAHRVLPDLVTGRAEQAAAIAIEVPVEHPARGARARDVFLKQEVVWLQRHDLVCLFASACDGNAWDAARVGRPPFDPLDHHRDTEVVKDVVELRRAVDPRDACGRKPVFTREPPPWSICSTACAQDPLAGAEIENRARGVRHARRG